VLSILAAGAHGFIPKQIGNCRELLHAIQCVEESGIFVPLNLIEAPAAAEEHDEDDINPDTISRLTERQQQVVRLLSEGHANKVIARQLGISPSTVKVHVHAAFRALGVHSRIAALAALRCTRGTQLQM
jgi:DNA-binding NarL/FixJ family response regulator